MRATLLIAAAGLALAPAAVAQGRTGGGRPPFDVQAAAVARLQCNVSRWETNTMDVDVSNPTDTTIQPGPILHWRLRDGNGVTIRTGDYTVQSIMAPHLAHRMAVVPRNDDQRSCDFHGDEEPPLLLHPSQLGPRIVDRGLVNRPAPHPGPVRGSNGEQR